MPRRLPSFPLFPYTTLFRSPQRSAATASLSPSAPTPRISWLGTPITPPTSSCGIARRVRQSWSASRQIGKHTSELQSPMYLVCRLLLEKKTPDNLDECCDFL